MPSSVFFGSARQARLEAKETLPDLSCKGIITT